MSTPLRCLHVEDSEDDARLVRRSLCDGGYEVVFERVETAEAMGAALGRGGWELVISDFKMPAFTGLAALEVLKASGLDLPFIIVSGTIGEDMAVEVMRSGAHDYVMKDNLTRLGAAVRRELHHAAVRRDRRQADDALRRTLTLLDMAGRMANFGAWSVNLADGKVTWSDEVARIHDEPPGDSLVVAKGINYYAPEWREKIVAVFGACAKDGTPYDEEMEIITARGRRVWVRTMAEAVRDATGKIVQVHGAFQDITTRMEAKAALLLNTAALTAAANAIIITDREGATVWVNPAFTALTGYPLAEARGMNPRDLVKSGKTDREVIRQLWETILAGRVWRGELINRRKDGTIYPEMQTITPVRDAAGAITHFIAIKQDLTEQKRADEAMRQQTTELRASNEQLVRFNKVAVGRELRMIELKQEVNELCRRLGDPPRFRIPAPAAPEQESPP